MTKKRKISLAAITGSLIVIPLFLLLISRDQSLTRLQKTGEIKIGYAVEAPYVFLKSGGEVTGEEVEVARVIVSRLNIQNITWRLVEFNNLIPELEAGRIDIIVAGMFITPERGTRVSFSEPTFHVQQGLLVADGNPKQLQSYSQATTQTGIKIAVISGAIEEALLMDMGVDDSQIVRVPDALTGRVAVETGIVDGLALSALTIRWMASQDQLGRTEVAKPFSQENLPQYQRLGYGAVVFRQKDKQLREAWNVALKNFIGSPEHLNLLGTFGFTLQELPGIVTTKEILSQP